MIGMQQPHNRSQESRSRISHCSLDVGCDKSVSTFADLGRGVWTVVHTVASGAGGDMHWHVGLAPRRRSGAVACCADSKLVRRSSLPALQNTTKYEL